MKPDEVTRYVVVFDCNIYLDAARLLGEPFTWDKVESAMKTLVSAPVPHPGNGECDSLRSLVAAHAGRFGEEPLEVWTSVQIDKMVRNMAARSAFPKIMNDYKGLGWSAEAAGGIVELLIHELVERSRGGILGDHFPDGNPPLDHEDGMIYGACRLLAGEDPLAIVYCVTRDKGFVDAYEKGALSGHSAVIQPATFVGWIRLASLRTRLGRIPRPRG
ncbi:hypothetical protein [Winogradskya humida]|uniref:PIN domain-containing protein n=1 Tax=Winogradskya humida TaxID=113566 RepID=A0ABQ3ZM51_9ACTN|nr:hypothetical protein [Actinoplanes humidus]GIE19665.1 hypothetical protein Ahu01nite_027670 [Actinoplanes humidus]